jgi:hypothetical protein
MPSGPVVARSLCEKEDAGLYLGRDVFYLLVFFNLFFIILFKKKLFREYYLFKTKIIIIYHNIKKGIQNLTTNFSWIFSFE